MRFCNNCGEAIEESVVECPYCHAQFKSIENDDVAVVYNETKNSTSETASSKGNKAIGAVKEKFFPIVTNYRKPVFAVLAVLSLIFVIVAVTTITSKNYQEYAGNYSEYMENYEENLSTSKSYGGYGILGSGYQRVADGWKDLADDMSAKLWGLRVQAIIFTIVSVICAVFAIKVYKLPATVKEQEKNLL